MLAHTGCSVPVLHPSFRFGFWHCYLHAALVGRIIPVEEPPTEVQLIVLVRPSLGYFNFECFQQCPLNTLLRCEMVWLKHCKIHGHPRHQASGERERCCFERWAADASAACLVWQ